MISRTELRLNEHILRLTAALARHDRTAAEKFFLAALPDLDKDFAGVGCRFFAETGAETGVDHPDPMPTAPAGVTGTPTPAAPFGAAPYRPSGWLFGRN